MQLILPEILFEARGMSLAVYITAAVLGFLLWFTGWWGHRFWIVLFTTIAAGIVGLASGRTAGLQPFAVGVLLAVTAGMMALALARMLAFASSGITAWLLLKVAAPTWEEPLITFLGGGLVGLVFFRGWTMLTTSLSGTLLMAYSGLCLADKLGKIDAFEWAEKKSLLLTSICAAVALLGWLAQLTVERMLKYQAKQRKEQESLEKAEKELEDRYRRQAKWWWKWAGRRAA